MTVKTGKKLEGYTPGPLYAAPIRGAVLGFPETLRFLVANRERGWTGAAQTEADAELYAQAPTLLEQRDKLREELAGIAESAESAFDEVSDQTAAGRAARRIFERISKRAERVLREVEDGQ